MRLTLPSKELRMTASFPTITSGIIYFINITGTMMSFAKYILSMICVAATMGVHCAIMVKVTKITSSAVHAAH